MALTKGQLAELEEKALASPWYGQSWVIRHGIPVLVAEVRELEQQIADLTARCARVEGERDGACRALMTILVMDESDYVDDEARFRMARVAQSTLDKLRGKPEAPTSVVEGERDGLRARVEKAIRDIDAHQDIVGWQPYDSRNRLVCELRDIVQAALDGPSVVERDGAATGKP